MKNHEGRRPKGRDAIKTEPGLVCGISVRHARVLCGERLVRCRYGIEMRDRDREFTRMIAAGDRVTVSFPPRSEPVLSEVMKRTNHLSRIHGPSQREQIIVANPDRILIVVSAVDPVFRPRLVDRILVAAERSGAPAILVITKVDLVADRSEIEGWASLYRSIGYGVISCSTVTGEGVDELRARVVGGITVACGQSGVGKSSLLTALAPELNLKTQAISDRWRKGQHTTTSVELYPFVGGGFLADTPGVKSFGIAGLDAPDIALFFREFQPFIESCRFRSCTHTHEPECAVARAALEGAIDRRRFESYLRIVTGVSLDDDLDDEEENDEEPAAPVEG